LKRAFAQCAVQAAGRKHFGVKHRFSSFSWIGRQSIEPVIFLIHLIRLCPPFGPIRPTDGFLGLQMRWLMQAAVFRQPPRRRTETASFS
jgi:hypothetical protein